MEAFATIISDGTKAGIYDAYVHLGTYRSSASPLADHVASDVRHQIKPITSREYYLGCAEEHWQSEIIHNSTSEEKGTLPGRHHGHIGREGDA